MDSLFNTKLSYTGGTGHLFHLLEHILPLLNESQSNIWYRNRNNNAPLYIVFQEKSSVENIQPLGRLFLSSILSGGFNNKYGVIFGYSDQILNNSNNETIAYNFHQTNIIHSNNSIGNDFIKFYHDSSPINIKLNVLLKNSWKPVNGRMKWFQYNSTFTKFRNSIYRSCNIPLDNDNNNKFDIKWHNSTNYYDDLTLISPWVLKKYQKGKHLLGLNTPSVKVNYKTITIYQRDNSRRFSDIFKIKALLELKLNNDTTITSKDSNNWKVEIITHSDNTPPCELVSKISQSTILVTPHGFQSVMVLLQPLIAMLIEIQPFGYYKPQTYGTIQANLRHNLFLPRSYLTEESTPVSLLAKSVSLLRNYSVISDNTCINNIICKYFIRNQDVQISDKFLNRIIDFINHNF
jgi:hypothetical protein